jgi:hypothetical protein
MRQLAVHDTLQTWTLHGVWGLPWWPCAVLFYKCLPAGVCFTGRDVDLGVLCMTLPETLGTVGVLASVEIQESSAT